MSVLNYIIQIAVSIIIILLFHYLYNYFKDTYTTKKTKNTYHFQQNKYNEIFETVRQGTEKNKIAEQEQNELLEFVLDGPEINGDLSKDLAQNLEEYMAEIA